ncbi:MAG TPA: TRAP transporter large permease subunit [Candidatus Aphodomonas merdavium]|nr:TRAP transporter large permease subunit [Candidatus Aphodomonas merdavium]
MDIEFIVLLSMLAVFLLGNFLLKLPVSLSMIAGAIVGALVGGEGIPLRHLFEGTFTYIDTILIIATAMIFMTVIQESGALEALNAAIVTRFYKKPAIMLILLMFMIMFPGMITGSSTAAVLSAGALVAPALILIGIPKANAGAILAIGSIMGMAAPPVNIPAMLISGGVDMPYIGFEGPLFLVTIPCAVFAVLFLGLRYCKNLEIDKIKAELNLEIGRKYGLKLYIPIVVLFVLMVTTRLLPSVMPALGTPLIFLISAVIGLFTGRKFAVVEKCSESMKTTIPVLGKLMGVGMFIQILTLTGARGWIVVSCLGLGLTLLYAAVCIVMPAFGAVSSYGAATVMGVPFLLVLLDTGDQVVIAAMLSFICCLGDLMPPTALAGNYAAQIVGLKYRYVLKHCVVPFLVCVGVGLICLLKAGSLGFLT